MERREHQILIPRWVKRIAILGSGRVNRRQEFVILYFIPTYLLIIAIMLACMAAGILDSHRIIQMDAYSPRTGRHIGFQPWVEVSSNIAIALVVLLPLSIWMMRYFAFRWIDRTWKRLTGEPDLERYFLDWHHLKAEMRSTLTSVALRVRYGEIPADDFHLARDIAWLHRLCDKELRMRELLPSHLK